MMMMMMGNSLILLISIIGSFSNLVHSEKTKRKNESVVFVCFFGAKNTISNSKLVV